MKKKILAIGGIIAILLLGIMSASLINYFGRITGEVTVEAPTFYASGKHPLGGITYWGLGINDYVKRDDPVSFTGATYPKLFVSEQLGINSFYAANYEMSIEAESDNESGQIDTELWIIEGDDPNNKKELICHGSTSEPVYDKKIYSVSCSSGELSLDETDRLVWILTDGLNDIHYSVYIQGNTKIEVTAT